MIVNIVPYSDCGAVTTLINEGLGSIEKKDDGSRFTEWQRKEKSKRHDGEE